MTPAQRSAASLRGLALRRDAERPEWWRGFDVRYRGLEIVTGGQRLHLDDAYLAALAVRCLDPAPVDGYLEAFRYGMPPVREATLFPRDRNRLLP